MDLRKQKGLQICKTKHIKRIEGGYLVPSQNSNKKYFVSSIDHVCTCPDCKKRQATCKHGYAVKYYLQIEKPDGSREKVPLTKGQAWHAYTEAQKSEVNKFDVLLKDLLESVEEASYSFGRPTLPLKEQLFCSVQKVYSQLSSRRAYSLFKNAETRSQIKKAPNYNSINKFLNRKDITPTLHRLIALSASPLKSVETDFAVDSTGFRTTSFNDYCREKHGEKKAHEWVKVHACTGVKTNIITGVRITGENGADCPQLAPLVKETAYNGFEVKEVSADLAYSSRQNYEVVSELGGQAYIPFKSNATGTSRGSLLWKKMFHYFQYNQEEFMKHYHKRSNVETTFHMIKSKFGDKLKSKNETARVNEMLCKILAHNLVVLIHEIYELGLSVKF